MLGFDPEDPALITDPYPAYARLREMAPVVWHEQHGSWLVPRHADVDRVLRDRAFGRAFVPREPYERFAPWNLVNEHAMLELEPPEHTRLRGLASRAFSPRRITRMRAGILATCDALIDPLEERLSDGEEVDVVRTFAEHLPVAVIADLLGFPEEGRALLRPWSNAIVALYEPFPDRSVEGAAIDAARDFAAALRGLIAARRRAPGDDLLSELAVLSVDGDRLSEDELVATAVLLLNAGHEASVNVIGNGLVALLERPDGWRRLVEDPGIVVRAVEELIRFDTPLSLFTRRVLAPVEVGGVALEPGETVSVLIASANRDPSVFDAPDRLDLGRDPNPQLGFGAGTHFCLGAALARLELAVAFGRLAERLPGLELAAAPTRRASYQFRGFAHVPVTTA
ncbi:MAG: hypothetical protein RLZZ272_1694 [Actinomycetota bacterium]